jgi:hypothetical protein
VLCVIFCAELFKVFSLNTGAKYGERGENKMIKNVAGLYLFREIAMIEVEKRKFSG